MDPPDSLAAHRCGGGRRGGDPRAVPGPSSRAKCGRIADPLPNSHRGAEPDTRSGTAGSDSRARSHLHAGHRDSLGDGIAVVQCHTNFHAHINLDAFPYADAYAQSYSNSHGHRKPHLDTYAHAQPNTRTNDVLTETAQSAYCNGHASPGAHTASPL